MQQLAGDLEHTKRLYKDSVEENGRLKARVEAEALNARSEQDVLSSEMQRREDIIAKLKTDQTNLTKVTKTYEEKVRESGVSRMCLSIKQLLCEVGKENNPV